MLDWSVSGKEALAILAVFMWGLYVTVKLWERKRRDD